MIHQFDVEPPAGTVISLDGQPYVLVGSEPYQRKDGEWSRLLSWHCECVQCGAPFTAQSGLTINHFNRRCQTHKRPGQWVNKAAKRAREPLPVAVFIPAADGTLVPFTRA